MKIGEIEITITLSEKFYEELKDPKDTDQQFIMKMIGLYHLSINAIRNGKVVGITDNVNKLETEFIGF